MIMEITLTSSGPEIKQIGVVKIDSDYQYHSEIDPFAEYELLQKGAENISNFNHQMMICNFYQFSEKEITVNGVTMKVADKGLYMRYEPRDNGDTVYRLLKLSGLSKKYLNPKASLESSEYGAWINNGQLQYEVPKVFNAVVNGLRYEI